MLLSFAAAMYYAINGVLRPEAVLVYNSLSPAAGESAPKLSAARGVSLVPGTEGDRRVTIKVETADKS